MTPRERGATPYERIRLDERIRLAAGRIRSRSLSRSPADSAAADSARARARADSIRADRLARRAADSIKAPLARAEMPAQTDIGDRYRWTRDELFSTGALTLGELLGRIPGVVNYASGWIATPHTNTYGGDFRRIRLFYDGIELDPLDTAGRTDARPECDSDVDARGARGRARGRRAAGVHEKLARAEDHAVHAG